LSGERILHASSICYSTPSRDMFSCVVSERVVLFNWRAGNSPDIGSKLVIPLLVAIPSINWTRQKASNK
jgi:hypothetical protein